jgi:DNA mismatch repair ATPase MutS
MEGEIILIEFHRNIDNRSLAIIDELGRGTSTRDGLAIALSIAEALVESKALVWFTTHFWELGNNGFSPLRAILTIIQHKS